MEGDSVVFYFITLFITDYLFHWRHVTSRLVSLAQCDFYCSATKQNGIAAGTNWRRIGIIE